MKPFLAFFFATIFFNMPDKIESKDTKFIDPSQKPIFSFGIITDSQYADYDPVGTRFYRSSLAKIREAITEFKENSVDFIINLGDLIDSNYMSYKPVLAIIDSSGLKTYNVTGNHDYSVESRFKKRLPLLTSSKEGHYSIDYDNFRFIFLDGNEISTYISNNKTIIKEANDYINTLKNKGEINAIEWNGGMSDRQLLWLTNQLDDASAKNQKVFLICHFPVFPYNVHNLLNYKEVLAILGKYKNIIAWFNGHNHAGNYGNFNMTHFITFRGMVETETSNSFAIVEVYKNKLWIKGYGREKNQILAY
jgi:manganese-dependent ADP-ribose/CDP-alcohol diphosphatase